MNNQQTLERAISKAIDNGWKNTEGIQPVFMKQTGSSFLVKEYIPKHYLFDIWELLAEHDFAKALWGEEKMELWFEDEDLCQTAQPLLGGLVSYPYNEGAAVGFKAPAWRYHLQMMIIAEDPIKYLGEHIDG